MTAAEESNSSLKVQLMGGGASGTKKDSQVRIMLYIMSLSVGVVSLL